MADTHNRGAVAPLDMQGNPLYPVDDSVSTPDVHIPTLLPIHDQAPSYHSSVSRSYDDDDDDDDDVDNTQAYSIHPPQASHSREDTYRENTLETRGSSPPPVHRLEESHDESYDEYPFELPGMGYDGRPYRDAETDAMNAATMQATYPEKALTGTVKSQHSLYSSARAANEFGTNPTYVQQTYVMNRAGTMVPLDYDEASILSNDDDFNIGRKNILERHITNNRWCRVAIVWSILQLVISGLLEVAIMSIHSGYITTLQGAMEPLDRTLKDDILPDARALLVYQGLFIASQIFQFVLCFAATTTASTFEVVSTTFFNGAVMGYTFLQFKQGISIAREQTTIMNLVKDTIYVGWPAVHPTKSLEIAQMVVMSIAFIGWLFLAFKLFRVLGWSLFKEIGADVNLRRKLKLYHIFFMTAKLCYFFYLCFDIQYLVLVLLYNKWSSKVMIITHAAIAMPLTLILLFISYWAMRKEIKSLMIVSLIGLLGGIGYLGYKMYDLQSSPQAKYQGSRNSLLFFEVVTIILSTATFAVGVLCYRNFGKGLKSHMELRRQLHKKQPVPITEQYPGRARKNNVYV